VAAEVKHEEKHKSFVTRREHFGRNNKIVKKSKSSILRGAAAIMFHGCAGTFKAWRDYVRARREDDVEMREIAHASDVLQKSPWLRTPKELEALRAYLRSFVSFIETLNAQQQRQLCKVANVVELPVGSGWIPLFTSRYFAFKTPLSR
jgi:hypothetical protein